MATLSLEDRLRSGGSHPLDALTEATGAVLHESQVATRHDTPPSFPAHEFEGGLCDLRRLLCAPHAGKEFGPERQGLRPRLRPLGEEAVDPREDLLRVAACRELELQV